MAQGRQPSGSAKSRRIRRSSIDKKPTQMMKKRLNRVVSTVLALFTIYIACNLANISIVKSSYYQELANSQQLNSVTISANRGTVYDVNGKALAQSATVWTIFIDPTYMREYEADKIDTVVNEFVKVLDVDEEIVREKIQKNNQYEEIAREIEQQQKDQILQFASDNKISSIYTTQGTKRYYPNSTLAASIIGFTNYDGDGAYGIEAYYNDYLSGTNGKLVSLRDSLGDEMPYRYETLYDAKDGNDVYLTIDSVLQYYLEKEMSDCVALHKPDNRACGIMLNPKNGEIYAMATTPGFDLNSPSEIYYADDQAYLASLPNSTDEQKAFYSSEKARLREKQWKNKAVTELYYPGSVFKTVTVASALDEGVVGLDDTFYCPGYANVEDTTFRCWDLGGHGTVNLVNAVATSCNPAHVEIGLRLGTNLFFKYFKTFGFTEITGIDLPGEAEGITIKENQFGLVELGSSAFGQTNKITPIQMVTAVAATVNGGYLITPHVVEKIVDSDGNIIYESQTETKRQVVSAKTSETMRYILETVVSTNGGKNAYIEGYRIGGKTGTSEKMDDYATTGVMNYVASFCGIAPANDPDLVMLIMVDGPTGGAIYGSVICAPVVSGVMKEALPYLGYYPEYTSEQLETAAVSVPYVVGSTHQQASSTLSQYGLDSKVIGNGSDVVMQYPATGTSVPRGSKILLYTESGAETLTSTVPNVSGMHPTEASAAITSAGLNPYLTGVTDDSNATAQTQSLAAGTTVQQGSVVEVNFVVIEEIQ